MRTVSRQRIKPSRHTGRHREIHTDQLLSGCRLRRPSERKGASDVSERSWNDLLKLEEQGLSLSQIPCLESFVKAAVHGSNDITCFGTLTLLDPQPGQIRGGATFERARFLAARRSQSLIERSLHFAMCCSAHEQRCGL